MPTIYVDPVKGDDSNSGLTSSSAKKTIAVACSDSWHDSRTIHIAPTTSYTSDGTGPDFGVMEYGNNGGDWPEWRDYCATKYSKPESETMTVTDEVHIITPDEVRHFDHKITRLINSTPRVTIDYGTNRFWLTYPSYAEGKTDDNGYVRVCVTYEAEVYDDKTA